MAGYEQLIIVGHVGRDVETRNTPSGSNVSSFTVAVSESWTDKQSGEKREKTKWFRVSVWNRLAEVAAEYVKKGTQIMVIGTVDTRAYMGDDGEARASLEMTGTSFKLLGSGNNAPRDEQADNDDIPF